MLKITMVRGAQSAGVVTYESSGERGVTGVRCRVVNGKRTDLSELLVTRLGRSLRAAEDNPNLPPPTARLWAFVRNRVKDAAFIRWGDGVTIVGKRGYELSTEV